MFVRLPCSTLEVCPRRESSQRRMYVPSITDYLERSRILNPVHVIAKTCASLAVLCSVDCNVHKIYQIVAEGVSAGPKLGQHAEAGEAPCRQAHLHIISYSSSSLPKLHRSNSNGMESKMRPIENRLAAPKPLKSPFQADHMEQWLFCKE
jgi:hypothetical protein